MIALALRIPGSTVLLDDSQAPRVAERFDVIRIGTMGILRRAKKAGLIGSIAHYTMQLQDWRTYIRKKLIDAMLRDVGELRFPDPCRLLAVLSGSMHGTKWQKDVPATLGQSNNLFIGINFFCSIANGQGSGSLELA